VAPSQLHPNSWAFIWGFIILCSKLGISPTVEVFFYFFEFKQYGRQLWASLNGVSGRGMFTFFQSSYKNFKGQFIKVCASVGDPTLLDGFPLYWSPNPRYQSARRLEDLSPRERGICEFLENLKVVFDTSTLLTKEIPFGFSQGLYWYTLFLSPAFERCLDLWILKLVSYLFCGEHTFFD